MRLSIICLFVVLGGWASFAMNHDLARQRNFTILMLTVLNSQHADGTLEIPKVEPDEKPPCQKAAFKQRNPDKFCPNRHETKSRRDVSRRGAKRDFYGPSNRENH